MPDNNIQSFETKILQIGNNTGIDVPEEIVMRLEGGKKPPVHVTINNYSYRSSIAVMGGKFMIGISAAIRAQTGLKGGDKIKVTLALDTEPREVVLPLDFKAALKKEPLAEIHFEKLSYSNKLRIVLPFDQAKTEETRKKRIEKAVIDLKAGIKK